MQREKLVTIIFPTRSRLEYLQKLLISIEEKTYNKDRVEVIAICDHDDTDTLKLLQSMAVNLTYDFYYVSRKQMTKLDLPNDYYSLGLKLASKSYFTWILGNDCEIRTENWDENLYASLEESIPNWKTIINNNEKYLYVKINDDTHWNEENAPIGNARMYGDFSCCFPLLSSNYCESSGEFYPREIPLWGGDTILYHILTTTPKLMELDAVNLVGIRHYSMHNKRALQDDISKRIETLHLQGRITTVDSNGVAHQVDSWSVPENYRAMLEKRKHIL